ncbi:MAG: hypothetical protein AB2A00_24850 [Myxococcota bacterium]
MAATAAADKAAKLAEKKAKLAAKNIKAPPPPASALRRLPLFQDAPDEVLKIFEATAKGEVVERDVLFLGGDAPKAPEPSLNFVVAGQVGVAVGTEDGLAASKKKVKAETFKAEGQTLAVFGAGDFFADDITAAAGGLHVYAITEVQLIRVPARRAAEVLQKHPKFQDELRNHAENWIHRIQQLRESGREEIFDFFVKNGFSFSTRTKIRQLELCIDCDKCVQACEDRHGFSRLERFGPQVGLINFSISCRQCYDPRCLIDCNFNAINRDPISNEIRIAMENCTGCNVCARNCPNDSIFIYDIPENFDTTVWDNAGKKVPKKNAVKCDRCAGYDDMACISACPTGSMIDAVPELLFGLSANVATEDACAVDPFEKGLSTQEGGRWLPRFSYWLAGILTVACLFEWIFRRWIPDLSFMPFFPEDNQMEGGFDSGRGLGLWLGIIGASCMGGTLIYSMRNRIPALSFIGSKYTWFALHNALGTLGPALVFLHGNLNFSKWPSLGVYAMTLVVISGLLGQYIANQIPGKEFSIDRELKDLDKSITTLASQWNQHTRSINMLELIMEEERARQPKDENLGSWKFLLFLATSDIQRWRRLLQLRLGGLKNIKNKALRKQTLELIDSKLVLERRQRFYGTAQRLMGKWKRFHIVTSIVLFVIGTLHIGVVLYY